MEKLKRDVKQKLGLSYEQLAEKLGVSKQTVYRKMNAKIDFTYAEQVVLSNLFGIQLETFMERYYTVEND